ncbi:hypothetical protein B0A55_02323 [Friedmanniomyces simplex]|uniref:Uncharacterized protein n=1 Tax=Friedmanniomyces simplex TaxID=329884 RepID=A0A4U0XZ64_9PEZI|nr:hypothetical protein B0A55_02323 [Friedmanniomyces simplex]
MSDGLASEASLRETLINDLTTAVVGDVLDAMGYHHQFLPPGIVPLQPDRKLVGRAMPVLQEDRPTPTNHPDDKPFGLLFEALDDLKEGEVYLATGNSAHYALFGGLMSTRAQHLKAAGAVLDGYVRDASEIEKLGFTIFSHGLYAQDQGARGKVTHYRCAVTIGDVRVEPGDMVFGDREGVLVVPRDVEQEAVRRAVEKAGTENRVEMAIRDGMGATEAFKKFGVF